MARKKLRRVSEVQSIIFNKFDADGSRLWGMVDCINWLAVHGYKFDKVDETANTFRFRQLPVIFDKYRIKDIAVGVKFVLGFHVN